MSGIQMECRSCKTGFALFLSSFRISSSSETLSQHEVYFAKWNQ